MRPFGLTSSYMQLYRTLLFFHLRMILLTCQAGSGHLNQGHMRVGLLSLNEKKSTEDAIFLVQEFDDCVKKSGIDFDHDGGEVEKVLYVRKTFKENEF